MTRQLWKALFGTRRTRPAPLPRRRRPGLEALEDRCVPTVLTWIGPNGGLWSNPANWGGQAPRTGDTVQFGSSFGGAVTSSVDDISGLSVAYMTIDSSFGTTYGAAIPITLNQSLTVEGQLSQSSGEILTGQTLQILYTGSFDWYGGILLGTAPGQGTLKIANYNFKNIHLEGSMDIEGGQYLGLNLVNYGGVTMNKPFDLLMSNGAELDNYGQFIIYVDAGIQDSGWNGVYGSYLVNNYGGLLIKNDSVGTTDIGIGAVNLNVNYGSIDLASGSMVFTAGLAFQNEGTVDSFSGSGTLTFDGPFNQLPSTETPAILPLAEVGQGCSMLFDDGATISAGTMFDVYGGSTMTVNGILTVNGTGVIAFQGPSATSYPTLNVSLSIVDSGLVEPEQYTIINTGQLDVQSGGTLDVFGPENVLNGSVFSAGTVNIGTAQFSPGNDALIVNGYFEQDTGTINLVDSDSITVYPTAGGTGQFLQLAGAINTGSNDLIGAVGGIVIGSTLSDGGSLGLAGNVVLGGLSTVQFTTPYNSLLISGNLTDYGTLDMQLGYAQQSGVGPSDQVTVSGATTFAGGSVVNVTVPEPGVSGVAFNIFQCSNITGLPTVNVPPPGNGLVYALQVLGPNSYNPFNLPLGLWIDTGPA